VVDVAAGLGTIADTDEFEPSELIIRAASATNANIAVRSFRLGPPSDKNRLTWASIFSIEKN
jgi:hypothetical protein